MTKLFDSAYIYRGFDKVLKDLFGDIEDVLGNFTKDSPYEFKDKGDVFELKLAVPGYKKEHVKIEEKDKMLMVSAKNGDRSRSAVIPILEYEFKEIKAKVEDGLLTISLVKKEPEKSRVIKIE